MYVPDTGINGQNELVRMWRAQVTKPGLVIDERFNSGGQIPDRFIELLDRPLRNYWAVRDGKDWTHAAGQPASAPRRCSSTAGAARAAIASRSTSSSPGWDRSSACAPGAGLIGITGSPPLVDGGGVTVPAFAIYSTNGQWIIEGHGVDPDIEVVDDPGSDGPRRGPAA